MPEDVKDVFGFALHLVCLAKKHGQAKPLTGFGGAGVLEVIEDYKGDTYRAVYTVKLANSSLRFCTVSRRNRKMVLGHLPDVDLIWERLKARVAVAARREMIEIEEGSGNVYADLGSRDANEMLVKARLATKIREIIKHRHLTPTTRGGNPWHFSAEAWHATRSVSRISEAKMLECLNRLGRDVQIVVRSIAGVRASGRTSVVFPDGARLSCRSISSTWLARCCRF